MNKSSATFNAQKNIRRILLGVAALALLVGCPSKPEPKVLKVQPRPELAAAQDALVVTGVGALPADKPQGQARLMAERAAKLDALRQLAAVVGEWRTQTVAGGIQVDVEGFVQGAQQVSSTLDSTNGVARVTLSLPVNGAGSVAGALGYDRIEVVTAADPKAGH